mgnify:CR=1 FL=1|jgi:uncharacterized membrane protein
MTVSIQPSEQSSDPKWGGVKVVYFLYISSFFFGFTGIIGVVIAYVFKGENEMTDSHFRWQIRTFWIGILIALLAVVTTFIGLGWILLIAFVVWYLVRVIKGIKAAFDMKPIQNPTSWFF